MPIAALLLWMCTAAAGSYLLVSAIRARQAVPPAVPRPQQQPVIAPASAAPRPARAKDRFDPPSLARAKSEPLPGLRALAEFTHPALAITGFAFWLGYVMSRDRLFAAIGLGVLLGAISAGLTWSASNARAASRAARQAGEAGAPGAEDEAGAPADGGARAPRPADYALSFSPRLLILHAVGAAATLLFVVLVTARV